MKCAIIQPCYIPWRGYFDIIHDVDVFVFHDDIQYTKQDWRNRNRIKTAGGLKWVTVPVGDVKTETPIHQVRITDQSWAGRHMALFRGSYENTPFFKVCMEFLLPIYETKWSLLADLDICLTEEIARFLGIRTRFLRSSEMGIEGKKTERIIAICRKAGADQYLSGPAARDYLDEPWLKREGIQLSYKHYEYPPYPQFHGPFEAQVSIVDLLCHCGPSAPDYIWNFKRDSFHDH